MKPILVYNRYSRRIDQEPLCGEWFMRFAYGNIAGRLLQRYLFSLPFLARIAGSYANSSKSKKRIAPFIKKYGIDSREFLLAPSQFRTFNEFFYRELKPDARPINNRRDTVVAPTDGRYYYIPNLADQKRIMVKGRKLKLERLLGSSRLAKKFNQGSAVIVRLCPMDYHRFHFPCDGIPGNPKLIDGHLQSVHRIALNYCRPFMENRRYITRIVATIGEVLMIEVGATFIGSVNQIYTPHKHVKKGLEKGFFSFGGSSVLLLFEPNRIKPASDLEEQSSLGNEIFIRMGDTILLNK